MNISAILRKAGQLGAGLLAALTLTACTDWHAAPRTLQDDFGNSVRHMIQAQTAYPDAAANPGKEPPTLIDGPKGSAVVDNHRKTLATPADSKKPITFGLTSGGLN